MKTFQILSHTADFRIKVYGKNLEELFENALNAIFEIVRPTKLGKAIKSKIKVASLNQNVLLVDFLNAVVFEMQTKKAIFNRIKIEKLTDTNIEAQILGNNVEKFTKDIKAVTYHEVDIKKSASGGLETNLVFDI